MNTIPSLDAELLHRYDQPGPRYTSYPTAPQFSPDFGEARLLDHMRRSNESVPGRRLSLYVHVPYCSSPCFYCGCNRIITRDTTRAATYLDLLLREIRQAAPWFDCGREVAQLHLGGGTPNFLSPQQLDALLRELQRHFRFAVPSSRDFSIEIDPRYISAADVGIYADAGFNRMSLGVQDFDRDVQVAVNRIQTVEQTLGVIEAARANAFRSVNIDLIYGLPKQTLEGFGRTLDTVIGVRPERVAIYGYAHLPQVFKAQRQIQAEDLPSAAARIDLLRLAIEKLGAAGYRYIGMDHFALPHDELARAQEAGTLHRNFMGYTTHADCDLVGFGVSAISHIGNSFSQNFRDLPNWEAAVREGRPPVWRGMTLAEDDVVRAEVIQQLMCDGRLDIAALEQRFGIEFSRYFAESLQRLQSLAADGLVTVSDSVVAATARGRLLLRNIAMCFDRYLQEPRATHARAI